MANPYYNASGVPAASSPAQSSTIRSELLLIDNGFSKLCGFTPANRFVGINSVATAWEVRSGEPYLQGSGTDASIEFLGGNGTASFGYNVRAYTYVLLGELLILHYSVNVTVTIGTATGTMIVNIPALQSMTVNGGVGFGWGLFGPAIANTDAYGPYLVFANTIPRLAMIYNDANGSSGVPLLVDASHFASTTTYSIAGSIVVPFNGS